MKKILSVALGVLAILSASANVPRSTMKEARTAIDTGQSMRPVFKSRTMQRGSIRQSEQYASSSPLSRQTIKTTNNQSRITAAGATIYGYLGYTTTPEETPIGLYTLNIPGYELQWSDINYENEGFVLSSGWCIDDKLCGFAPVEFFGSIYDLYYFEYDLSTGAVITDRQASMSKGMFTSATYNPTDKCIYGFGDHTIEGLSFMKASATAPDNMECIKAFGDDYDNLCASITYNAADGKIYGITQSGTLVTIATDGTETMVMPLEGIEVSEYVGGLAYSPIEDVFYWNLITDFESDIYKIDVTAKTVTKAESFGTSATFPILFTTDEKIDNDTPAMPMLVSTAFADGSCSGTITYRMPSTTVGGTSLFGDMTWTAMVDNVVHKSGTAAPGTDIQVQYTDLSEGINNFTFVATSGDKNSRPCLTTIYIGNDTPNAPTNVSLTQNSVSWLAVSGGANGGYVDLAELKYEVSLNGVPVGTTTATSIAIEIPDAALCSYEASVVATSNGKTSAPGISNTIISGKPFIPDVTLAPTESEAKLFTIVDATDNGNTWVFDDMYDLPSFATGYDDYAPMDDWLFLPPTSLSDPDKFYTFSMDCRRRGSYYEEDYIEVCIGTSPDPAAMTTVIIPKMVPEYFWEWEEWGHCSNMFQIPADGIYYIGIHCLSAAHQYGVVVRNFSITDQGITSASPEEATDITVEGASEGKLQAIVCFKFPTKDISGKLIDASTDLTATVTGASTVCVSGKPGETATATVATQQGDNTIAITVAAGSINGLTTEVSVFTGVHIPNVVNNLTGTVTADMLGFELHWEAPTDGEDGGYINAQEVEYELYTYDQTWGWQKALDLGTGVTSYTYTVPVGTEQDLFRMGIVTKNIAGEGSRVTGLTAILGVPYTLPMGEIFEGSSDDPFQINPWTYYTPADAYNGQRWSVEKVSTLSSDWTDITTSALVGTQSNATGKGKMGMPCFTTAGITDAEILLDAWTGKNAASISITGKAAGMDNEIEVGTIPAGNGWRKVTLPLPEEFNDKGWVQLYIVANYKTAADMCIIESIDVTGTSGIEGTTLISGQAAGAKGFIEITGFEGENISIYSIDGKTVKTFTSDGSNSITAAAGIYIVQAGKNIFKVIVK